jgi:hypothetical protein
MLRLSVRKGLRFLPIKIFLLEVANLYFDTYFSGLWAEQPPDGRLETERNVAGHCEAHVVSLMCTLVRFRLISITRLSLPYWKPCINFNLVMTSCEYARNSVLKSSMNQTSRTFSCRPSYMLPHFYLMRVSSTSLNTFFDIIGKDPMLAWDVATVDGQLCRDIVEAARQ